MEGFTRNLASVRRERFEAAMIPNFTVQKTELESSSLGHMFEEQDHSSTKTCKVCV